MSHPDFLLEIGCSELPAKSLLPLSQALKENMAVQLNLAQLTFKTIKTFSTPRRLAILITELSTQQPAQILERQGPGIEAAFDKDGTPTLACIGFARSCGVSADQLQVKETDKGKRIFCRVEKAGEKTLNLLPEIITTTFNKLPLSKPMRWGSQEKAFVRPVQWLVAIYGRQVVPVELFNLKAGANTYGHRFHKPDAITIHEPQNYAHYLQNPGMVIADFAKRKQRIIEQMTKKSSPYGTVITDEKLLEEVTALVEWPIILIGEFNSTFLAVPAEVLITSMKVHQKCFPIINANGTLSAHFVIVSNIESKDPNVVIKGNERVINARLADAAFFYKNDLHQPLDYFVDRLATVVFQKQLGTLLDRSKRLVILTTSIAKQLGQNPTQAKRAAELAKFDLMTEMVGEFPELQGIMGYYYAKHAKEAIPVQDAIKEHYYPRFSGDRLPQDKLSAALALADRIDLLVGIFGINLIPSGEKDPYALRRAAVGIVRIIIEQQLPLDLAELLPIAEHCYAALPNKNVVAETFLFITERMRSWYLEQGVSAEVFAAVLACKPSKPFDFDQRLRAVQRFQTLPESSSLAAANKRVSNLLKKSSDQTPERNINTALFENDSERQLAELLQQKTKQVDKLYQAANYTAALTALATLRDPVDNFFDNVMIMAKDEKVRTNRLALLNELHQLFTQVADISLLP